MKETRKTLKYMIAAVIVCVLFGAGGFLAGKTAASDKKADMSAVVIQNQVTAMSELGTMTYSYTELGKYETKNDFYGVTIPFTTNSFILTYEGKIKAGVDMSEAKVAVKDKNVTITLPKAKILSHEIDEDSIEIYDEKTSIFNPFTVKDYAEFYADQKEKVEKKALAKGLLTEAQKQAETVISGMLSELVEEGYKIRFDAMHS